MSLNIIDRATEIDDILRLLRQNSDEQLRVAKQLRNAIMTLNFTISKGSSPAPLNLPAEIQIPIAAEGKEPEPTSKKELAEQAVLESSKSGKYKVRHVTMTNYFSLDGNTGTASNPQNVQTTTAKPSFWPKVETLFWVYEVTFILAGIDPIPAAGASPPRMHIRLLSDNKLVAPEEPSEWAAGATGDTGLKGLTYAIITQDHVTHKLKTDFTIVGNESIVNMQYYSEALAGAGAWKMAIDVRGFIFHVKHPLAYIFE